MYSRPSSSHTRLPLPRTMTRSPETLPNVPPGRALAALWRIDDCAPCVMPAAAIVSDSRRHDIGQSVLRKRPHRRFCRRYNVVFSLVSATVDGKAPPFSPQCHRTPMATLHLTQHRVDTLRPEQGHLVVSLARRRSRLILPGGRSLSPRGGSPGSDAAVAGRSGARSAGRVSVNRSSRRGERNVDKARGGGLGGFGAAVVARG